MAPPRSLLEEATAAPLPAAKAPASGGWETLDKCLFSARVVEAATPPADGSGTSCASLLSAAMLAMVSDGAITLYHSPLYRLARVHVEGLREQMSGHRVCGAVAFADLNLPPTPAGLAKNIMARRGFMAQSLVLPLPRAGGMRHHETRMKMRADQVSTASSLPR